ncbi:MAG: hypothetical protein GY768_22290, partial [Planctomycetaceae bacterium]|nr:hypothetical protein [Planctomycetaceae bacterium]
MDDSAAASAKKNSFCGYEDDAKPCADDRKPAPKVVDDRKPALYKEQLATEDGKAAGGTAYQAKQKPLAKSDARNPIGVLEDGKPYAVPDNGMPFAAVLHHEHPHETMAAPSAATPKRDSFHGYDYDAMAAGDDRKPAAKPVSEDGKPAEEDRKPAAYNGHSKPVLDDVKLAEDNRKPAAYNGLPPSQDPTSFDYAIPNAEHLAFLQQENECLRASIAASAATYSKKDSFYGYKDDGTPSANDQKPATLPDNEHLRATAAAAAAASSMKDSFLGYEYDAMFAVEDQNLTAKPVLGDDKLSEDDRKPAAEVNDAACEVSPSIGDIHLPGINNSCHDGVTDNPLVGISSKRTASPYFLHRKKVKLGDVKKVCNPEDWLSGEAIGTRVSKRRLLQAERRELLRCQPFYVEIMKPEWYQMPESKQESIVQHGPLSMIRMPFVDEIVFVIQSADGVQMTICRDLKTPHGRVKFRKGSAYPTAAGLGIRKVTILDPDTFSYPIPRDLTSCKFVETFRVDENTAKAINWIEFAELLDEFGGKDKKRGNKYTDFGFTSGHSYKRDSSGFSR